MSDAEIKKILEATKKPFNLHKDVAQQFMVSTRLVGAIVYEAEKCPEK